MSAPQGNSGLGGLTTGLTSWTSSPSARNVFFACLGAVGFFLSVRSIPRVASKDQIEKERISKRERGLFHSIDLSSGEHVSTSSKNDIAIFWDVDNCQPPSGASGHSVAKSIREAAQSAGPDSEKPGSIVSFKAYMELSSENTTPNASQVQLRSELQGSGVSLIDTPKSGRKDVADKMMIADLLSFAIDKRPPALIVLLSGDRDFAYPLGILRNRGYQVLLITPPIGATPILEASANYIMKWRQDVLGILHDANGRSYDEQDKKSGVTAKDNMMADLFKQLKSTSLSGKAESSAASAIPPVFAPLVKVLVQLQKEGQGMPKRSLASVRLRLEDPHVYEKAGANSWGEYVAVAESAGIISLGNGSQVGLEWISLSKYMQKHLLASEKFAKPASLTTTTGSTAAFYPLIEVYKHIKTEIPSTELPLASVVAKHLNILAENHVVDAYAQGGAHNFNEYLRMAQDAKVARIVAERGPGKNDCIQIHPRCLTINTGLTIPRHILALLEIPGMSTTNLEAISSIPGASHISPKDTLLFPHKPSGEIIHAKFFPLANYLLSERAQGNLTSPEQHVHKSLLKHYKTGKEVATQEDFQTYMVEAENDNVVHIDKRKGTRFVILAPRLCKGEGQNMHKGHKVGEHKVLRSIHDNSSGRPFEDSQNETCRTSIDTGSSANSSGSDTSLVDDIPSGIKHLHRSPLKRSVHFNTVSATPQDRIVFKELIDLLVSMRRKAQEEYNQAKSTKGETSQLKKLFLAVEPLRAHITSSLIKVPASSKDGESIISVASSPGNWLQSRNYSSFGDYFGDAEKKGFIHIIRNKDDFTERIRLGDRYEDMFFPNSPSI